jgi:hypothetical protein
MNRERGRRAAATLVRRALSAGLVFDVSISGGESQLPCACVDSVPLAIGGVRFLASKIVDNVLCLLRNGPRHLCPTWPTTATWSEDVNFRIKRLFIVRGEEIKVVESTRSTACATPKLHSGCERHYRLIPIRRAIREERQRVRPALANLRGSVFV